MLRNVYYSKSMIENVDLAESFDMVAVIAGFSSMGVLNVNSYSSSPRFYHFVNIVSYKSQLINEVSTIVGIVNFMSNSIMLTI
jgi:hypothetical protein